MTKHGDIPRDFLEGFRGVWLSDGASNYNEVEDLDGVERGGCWSHGRRYVFEARNDHLAAMEGLELIRDLFMSERVAMTLAIPERQAHRDAIAAPLVERIRVWVATWRADVDVQRRPKSAFAKAVNYLHRQWAALTLFLSKPMIEIHNNRSELLLRGPVTGRHAWRLAVRRLAQRRRSQRDLVQPGRILHAPGRRPSRLPARRVARPQQEDAHAGPRAHAGKMGGSAAYRGCGRVARRSCAPATSAAPTGQTALCRAY
jgi:hypothetical protein